jgi:hypothetical protein
VREQRARHMDQRNREYAGLRRVRAGHLIGDGD